MHSSTPAAYGTTSRQAGSAWPSCGSRITGAMMPLAALMHRPMSIRPVLPEPSQPAMIVCFTPPPTPRTKYRSRTGMPSGKRPISARPVSRSMPCPSQPGLIQHAPRQDRQQPAGLIVGTGVGLGVAGCEPLVERGSDLLPPGGDLADVGADAVTVDGPLRRASPQVDPLAQVGRPLVGRAQPRPGDLDGPVRHGGLGGGAAPAVVLPPQARGDQPPGQVDRGPPARAPPGERLEPQG